MSLEDNLEQLKEMVHVDKAWRKKTKDELLEYITNTLPECSVETTPVSQPLFQPRWVFAARCALALVVVVLLAVPGSVIFAQQAIPGQPLYPVKRLTEEVQVALEPNPEARRILRQDQALRRVGELERVLQEGRSGSQDKAVAEVQKSIGELIDEEAGGSQVQAHQALNKIAEKIGQLEVEGVREQLQDEVEVIHDVLRQEESSQEGTEDMDLQPSPTQGVDAGTEAQESSSVEVDIPLEGSLTLSEEDEMAVDSGGLVGSLVVEEFVEEQQDNEVEDAGAETLVTNSQAPSGPSVPEVPEGPLPPVEERPTPTPLQEPAPPELQRAEGYEGQVPPEVPVGVPSIAETHSTPEVVTEEVEEEIAPTSTPWPETTATPTVEATSTPTPTPSGQEPQPSPGPTGPRAVGGEPSQSGPEKPTRPDRPRWRRYKDEIVKKVGEVDLIQTLLDTEAGNELDKPDRPTRPSRPSRPDRSD